MRSRLAYRIGTILDPALSLERVAALGIENVEVCWDDQTTAAAVESALASTGLRMTTLCSVCPIEDDDLPAMLGQRAAEGEQLGATAMFVSVRAGRMPKSEAYDRIRRLGDAVGEHHIYLSMETHPDLCQNGDQMVETMAAVNHPWVGVNFDTANVYYYNEHADAAVELKKAARHVRSVHLKDTHGGFKESDFPVIGEGIVGFKEIMGVLDGVGYRGPLAMELEGSTFDRRKPDELEKKLGACVAHLRGVGIV